MFYRFEAWLRGTRHRRLLRDALKSTSALQEVPLHAEFDHLVDEQFRHWREIQPPQGYALERILSRLDAEHPSIFIYDVEGRLVLPRRKVGCAGRHTVSRADARMYAKRVNHYTTLLAEVLAKGNARERFSLAIDVRDIPYECADFPVFGFQRLHGARIPLLPDVDFFHHAWYMSDRDDLPYAAKSITACFAGASTGQELTVADIRRSASERLALASQFVGNSRVTFRIASATHCVDAEAEMLLRAQPYFSARLPWQEQLLHRFLISVDGNGATCSRVVKALRSNSVLLKFASPYELFYFPLLREGEHYLLARSVSDVEHYLDTEATQPGYYSAVAAAGTTFAMRYLSAPAVLSYTALLLDRYASFYLRR